jgi:hypothetical protein
MINTAVGKARKGNKELIIGRFPDPGLGVSAPKRCCLAFKRPPARPPLGSASSLLRELAPATLRVSILCCPSPAPIAARCPRRYREAADMIRSSADRTGGGPGLKSRQTLQIDPRAAFPDLDLGHRVNLPKRAAEHPVVARVIRIEHQPAADPHLRGADGVGLGKWYY